MSYASFIYYVNDWQRYLEQNCDKWQPDYPDIPALFFDAQQKIRQLESALKAFEDVEKTYDQKYLASIDRILKEKGLGLCTAHNRDEGRIFRSFEVTSVLIEGTRASRAFSYPFREIHSLCRDHLLGNKNLNIVGFSWPRETKIMPVRVQGVFEFYHGDEWKLLDTSQVKDMRCAREVFTEFREATEEECAQLGIPRQKSFDG